MGVKSMLVREFGKDHTAHETLLFAVKLLGLDEDYVLNNHESVGQDEDVWRTTEEGRHFKFDNKTGQIKAGFGGKLNGKTIVPKEKLERKSKSETKAENKAETKAETKSTESETNSVSNGIKEKVDTNHDFSAFENSLTNDEKVFFMDQKEKAGSDESNKEYMERMYRMMESKNKTVNTNGANVPVNGKDLTKEYYWDKKPYTDEKFGQVIDTQIEDILVRQGFDGVPQIMKKDDFDKFIEEHPDSPIMMRTYTAPNQETLDQYDKDLESGAWYVDCSIGGSKYGQGMYTAAALPFNFDDVPSYDDPDVFDVYDPYGAKGKIIKNNTTGDFYQVKNEESMGRYYGNKIKEGDILVFPATKTKESHMVKVVKGDWGKDLIDMDTGEHFSGSDQYTRFAKLEQLDKEEMSKRDVSRPLGQMREYIDLNENRTNGESVATTTRMMTLDPSSKTITYDDLVKQYREYHNGHSYEMNKKQSIDETCKSEGFDKYETKLFKSFMKNIDRPTTPKVKESIQEAEDYFGKERIWEIKKKADENYEKISNRIVRDIGAFGALCGYDAVVCNNYGRTVVVYNRSKVIMSDERVNV